MGVMDEEYFYVAHTELPPSEQERADKEAIKLQQKFMFDWVINTNLDLYKTDQERDWSYLVRKELGYIHRKSWSIGFAQASLLSMFYSFRVKRISFVPFLLVPALAYYDYYPRVDSNTRRLFGMLNLGTEFELGAERNRVLEECNRITRRADF
jgi:hypothetical protein